MEKGAPKKVEDFQTKEYWDKFFAKRGGATFEWYGNYESLKEIIKKEMLPTNKVLILGCGNSLMSENLYDAGYKNITSIDYSEKVIAEMQARIMGREGLKYEVADITTVKYPEAAFDIVFDKATLDGMCSSETPESLARVNTMWNNILTILPNKGKYICVTLFQQHILSKVLSFFLHGNNNELFANFAYILKIYEAAQSEPEAGGDGDMHIPFVFVIEKTSIPMEKEGASKIKAMLSSMIYYISEKGQNLTIPQAIESIKNRQIFGYVMHKSKKFEAGQRLKIECFDTESKLNVPRYILTIIDSKKEKILKNKTCGVFIAPLGRENDYLFATEEGNFYLQSDSKYSRLIIVTLNHLHKFDNIEQIKKELSPKVVPLLPVDCKNKDKVPFLKIGDDIGKRVTIYNDKGIIVEDVADFDGTVIRRLFFESKIEQIQSEINLIAASKSDDPSVISTDCELFKTEEGKVVVINHKVLCSDYARAIVAGLSTISKTIMSKPEFKVIVLGTGAGVFSTFLRQNIGSSIVNTVDMDKTISEIGKKYFGFRPNEKLIPHCMEAEEYMNSVFGKKDPNPYDLIIIDLNNSDLSTGIVPAPNFYSKEFLQKIKENAGENEAMVAINMIWRSNEKERIQAIELFKSLFDIVFSIKLEKEINEVFFLIKKGPLSLPAVSFGKLQLTTLIHTLQNHLKVDWTKNMNTTQHIDNMLFHTEKEKKDKAEEPKKKKKKNKKY